MYCFLLSITLAMASLFSSNQMPYLDVNQLDFESDRPTLTSQS